MRLSRETKGSNLKTGTESDHADSKLVPELPICASRGMCRGIDTDVPNDAEPDVIGAPIRAPRHPPVTAAVARNQRDSVGGVHGSTGSPRTRKG